MINPTPEQRLSSQQHKALFQYLGDLANELNQAGVDQKMFIDHLKGWEIPITKEFLHHIWKLKQGKMGMGDSTTQLTTAQVSQVYDTINLFTSVEFGVASPFPNRDLTDDLS